MPHSKPLVLIPARAGSVRIPHKNFRPLAPDGQCAVELAISVAWQIAEPSQIWVTSDAPQQDWGACWLHRPAELASSTASTLDVVKHALRWLSGDPIILLQPTQPLRTAAHVRAALMALTNKRDSVVTIGLDRYVRDGTAYVFWRRTVKRFNNIYGNWVVLLPIPANETLPLDTPAEWAVAVKRLNQQHPATD